MNSLLIMKKFFLFPMMIMLALAILLSSAGPAVAQDNRAASGRNALPLAVVSQGPTDPAELEAFLDGFFTKNMEEYHIAGAAVAAVAFVWFLNYWNLLGWRY